MPTYIALIQEDADGIFRVSFPDLPGVVTAGDSLDEAIEEAEETLEYVAGEWTNPDGSNQLPMPRSMEQLQHDPDFAEAADGGHIVEIDYEADE
ncbi:type II toxin-antitoxin system HicB family antitoxin [Tardiphaga sp.]|uniref:type II toxin-antitoxin system HicB family antitoxin n=1 Tax=Tardiphaga sp. TaxID=1926292 RepID=UPI0025EB60FD|nr:type II toxin-antitoxin system HicB family antitoxin [Tardiphaga sp.]